MFIFLNFVIKLYNRIIFDLILMLLAIVLVLVLVFFYSVTFHLIMLKDLVENGD